MVLGVIAAIGLTGRQTVQSQGTAVPVDEGQIIVAQYEWDGTHQISLAALKAAIGELSKYRQENYASKKGQTEYLEELINEKLKFLAAIAAGHIVYDPALKLEDASSARPKLKRRSQFRISQPSLSVLYDDGGHVDVMSAA